MKNLVSVLIVNYNSADFTALNLYALSVLTKNNYQVFLIDNNSHADDYHRLKQAVNKYPNVFLERNNTKLKGSLAHGTALNNLVRKVDTPYFCILDADCVWLKKDWDEILLARVNDRVKVIGTPAPVGSPKPQDFPLVFGALFETKTFRALNIDFKPKDMAHHLDTGYETREKFLRHGFKGENLKMETTRRFKKGPFRDIICVEYYFDGRPDIFGSHFGRGSSLGQAKYASGTAFVYRVPCLGRVLSHLRGVWEKRKWLAICKRIIEQQKI